MANHAPDDADWRWNWEDLSKEDYETDESALGQKARERVDEMMEERSEALEAFLVALNVKFDDLNWDEVVLVEEFKPDEEEVVMRWRLEER